MEGRVKKTEIICFLMVMGLAATVLSVAPVHALQIHEMHPRGQVAVVETAQINGQKVGIMLVIERGLDEMPKSGLGLFPSPDPSGWRLINLPNAPGAMATGDITGDENDEVAIVHHFEGETCPFLHGGEIPCGVVKVYDGRALVDGKKEIVAEIIIRPQPGPCTPSNYPPAALELRDVTGDGRAEMALGQLALMPGHCGIVHVIPGKKLSGSIDLGEACTRITGPLVRENEPPDQFGVKLALYNAGPEARGVLAVAAPHSSNESASTAGRVTLYGMQDVCTDSGPLNHSEPKIIADRYGFVSGHQMGSSLALVEDLLWVSGRGGVLGLHPLTLKEHYGYPVERSFPLANAGDVIEDGRDELMVGPWVMTTGGQVVMAFNTFSEETFRGAMLSPDHAVVSDKFGSRIWSLTDLWTPNLELAHDPKTVYNGGTLNVSLSQVTSIVPIHDSLSWSITGGIVTQKGGSWVHVQTQAPGHVIVQAHLGSATQTLRVPVLVPEEEINVVGPGIVRASHPFTVRVSAPPDTLVEWDAPGAQPSQGTGRSIEIQYDEPSTNTIQVQARFPDGATATIQHEVHILEAGFDIQAPPTIPQGELLDMSVQDSEPELEYVWFLEGERMGPLGAKGTTIAVPTAGWGALNITVTAHTNPQEAVAAAHTKVRVDNLPPRIDSFNIQTGHNVEGLQASIRASDPGGDPLHVTWFIDGEPAGSGTTLRAPHLEGLVNLTVVVTDDGGLTTRQSQTVDVAPDWIIVSDTPAPQTNRTDPSNHQEDSAALPEGSEGSSAPNSPRDIPGPGGLFMVLVIGIMKALNPMKRRETQ